MAAQHVPPRSTEELRGSSNLLAAVAIRIGPIWHNDRAGLASLPVRARRVPPDAEVRRGPILWEDPEQDQADRGEGHEGEREADDRQVRSGDDAGGCEDWHSGSTERLVTARRGQWNVAEIFRRTKKSGVVPWSEIEATQVRTAGGGMGRRPTWLLAPDISPWKKRAIDTFELGRWMPELLSAGPARRKTSPFWFPAERPLAALRAMRVWTL